MAKEHSSSRHAKEMKEREKSNVEKSKDDYAAEKEFDAFHNENIRGERIHDKPCPDWIYKKEDE